MLSQPPSRWSLGDAVDGVDGQAEAVDFVVVREFHGRVDVAPLLVPAQVQVLFLRP
jgi:hypothetical protein